MQNRTQKAEEKICVCGMHKKNSLSSRSRERISLSSTKGNNSIDAFDSRLCSCFQSDKKSSTDNSPFSTSRAIIHNELKDPLAEKPSMIPSFKIPKIDQTEGNTDSRLWKSLLDIWAPTIADYFPSDTTSNIVLDPMEAESVRRIGMKNKLILDHYQRKYCAVRPNVSDEQSNIHDEKASIGEKCEYKADNNPLAREINFALFTSLGWNLPAANSPQYYALAEEYALLNEAPLRSMKSSAVDVTTESVNSNQSGNLKTLDDPAIISSVHRKRTTPFLSSDNTSNVMTSSQNIQPLIGVPLYAPPVQMHKSSIIQHSASSYYPNPSVSGNYNFPIYQATVTPLSTYQENCVNTAVVQQLLYRQYVLSTGYAPGYRELLLWEQKLHETQQFKTIYQPSRLVDTSIPPSLNSNPPGRALTHSRSLAKSASSQSISSLWDVKSNVQKMAVATKPKAKLNELNEEKSCEKREASKKKISNDEETSEEEFFDPML